MQKVMRTKLAELIIRHFPLFLTFIFMLIIALTQGIISRPIVFHSPQQVDITIGILAFDIWALSQFFRRKFYSGNAIKNDVGIYILIIFLSHLTLLFYSIVQTITIVPLVITISQYYLISYIPPFFLQHYCGGEEGL